MNNFRGQVGYDIMHCNNDAIKPSNSLESNAQKIVIFDDLIYDKNQKPLIDYFIQGRHKNCSVIYALVSGKPRTPIPGECGALAGDFSGF